MANNGGNSVSLDTIHRQLVEQGKDVGRINGRLDGVDKRLTGIESHLETVASGYVIHGQEIGLLRQRAQNHSEEILHLQQDQQSLQEGTGRIRIQVERDTAGRAVRHRLVKQAAALLGALLSGGGLGWLINTICNGG